MRTLNGIITPWSPSEAYYAAHIHTRKKIFCTFNTITPIWNQDIFHKALRSLHEKLQPRKEFYAYTLYYEIGYRGIHAHLMGSSNMPIKELRENLYKTWNSCLYRRGNVYVAYYKGSAISQTLYFQKKVATQYKIEGTSTEEALLDTWNKLLGSMPTKRFFLKTSKGNIRSPYELIGPQLKAAKSHLCEIKVLIQIGKHVDQEPILDFLVKNGCWASITAGGVKELFLPGLDEAALLRLRAYLHAKKINYVDYKIKSPEPFMILYKRLHGKVVALGGEGTFVFKSGGAKKPRIRTHTYQERKLRTVYSSKAEGSTSWGNFFGKEAFVFNLRIKRETQEKLCHSFRKQKIKAVLFSSQNSVRGVFESKKGPLLDLLKRRALTKRVRAPLINTHLFLASLTAERTWII